MKFKTLASVVACTSVLLACSGQEPSTEETSEAVVLETLEQKFSYTIGYQIGSQAKQEGFELDVNALVAAMEDLKAGGEMQLTEDDMAGVMRDMQAKIMAERQAEAAKIAEENSASGAAFLTENATKEGVTTTESGLQYKVITEGTGPKPGPTDSVTVHYRGTLTDGTEFDSSYSRGQPATFGVHQVIAGWTEALQLMPEGSKWELAIPSDLAYGPGGKGPVIGPNATLLFEVELLDAGQSDDDAEDEADTSAE
jgi:FKBP-type peptidyl-prolyl cis-trans isomerase FkpA/FKBP-type peptidyl-prolyl cis-trans isomerase FklB